MAINRHIITGVILNVIYPGAGYLYLRDPERRPIALFLTFIWTIFVIAIAYELIKGVITGQFYFFAGPMEISMLAVIMWSVMSIDTYGIAKRKFADKFELKTKRS